jgi:hypothetical protein
MEKVSNTRVFDQLIGELLRAVERECDGDLVMEMLDDEDKVRLTRIREERRIIAVQKIAKSLRKSP